MAVVETIFTLVDRASAKLDKLTYAGHSVTKSFEHAGHAVTHTFEHASSMLGAVGGIGAALAGAFELHSIVEESEHFLKNVQMIHMTTRMSAEDSSQLLGAMELIGMEGGEASRAMMMMSRRSVMVEQQMQKSTGHASGMTKWFKQMGVDVRKGPLDSILKLSEALKAGKTNATEIGVKMGMRGMIGVKFGKLLNKGPEGIKKLMGEVHESGGDVTSENLEMWEESKQHVREMQHAFFGIKLTLYKDLLPVLVPMFERIGEAIKGWMPYVHKFGEFLKNNLDTGISLATKLGVIMLANAAAMKVTGMGPLALIGKLGALAAKPVTALGNKAVGMLGMVAPGAATAARGIGSSGIGSILQLAGAIGIIALIAGGIYAIVTNAGEMRDRLEDAFAQFMDIVNIVGDSLGPAIAMMFGMDSPFSQSFITLLPKAIETIVKWTTELIAKAQALGGSVGDWLADKLDAGGNMSAKKRLLAGTGGENTSTLGRVFDKLQGIGTVAAALDLSEHRDTFASKLEQNAAAVHRDMEARKAARAADKAKHKKSEDEGKGKPPPNNFDFRGSKFDIKQEFAEGYDPDRIAVSLFDGIAELGERRVQSGLSGVFGV